MTTKRYEVTLDFVDEDGDEDDDTFEVDAEDIEQAEKLAIDELGQFHDYEEVINVEVREK